MGSGGARGAAGRPASTTSLRYNADEWTTLGKVNKNTKAPNFPLIAPSERETEKWRELWLTPQSTMWKQFGMQDEVAMFVRFFCEAELPGCPATTRTMVLRLQESLGLSMSGLNKHKWKLPVDELAVKRTANKVKLSSVPSQSSKDRLAAMAKAANGGAG